MRLKLLKSCSGFGSTVNGLEEKFSRLLYLLCNVIITHCIGLAVK